MVPVFSKGQGKAKELSFRQFLFNVFSYIGDILKSCRLSQDQIILAGSKQN